MCVRVGTDPSFRAARVLITQNLGHLLVHADHRSLRPPPPRPAASHGLSSAARRRTHSLLANAAAPPNASRLARCSPPPRQTSRLCTNELKNYFKTVLVRPWSSWNANHVTGEEPARSDTQTTTLGQRRHARKRVVSGEKRGGG